MTEMMRVARLHGIRDLRIESIPIPRPGPGELLVRIDACGVCPTDARKFQIGVNDGAYPFNPGHEWVGRVVDVGPDTPGWGAGDRVAADTYAGYAEYAVLPVRQGPENFNALRIGEATATDRIVFIEPLSCSLHALYDMARLAAGANVVIIGAGQMGLQLTAITRQAGATAHVIDRREDRRAVAMELGAATTHPGGDDWPVAIRERTGGTGADIVVISVGVPDLIEPSISATARGGSIVLFAGFGERGVVPVDINALHYREIALVGATASGIGHAQQRLRFEQARDLLEDGSLPLERLVSGHCGLEDLPAAFDDVVAQRVLKTILLPHGADAGGPQARTTEASA